VRTNTSLRIIVTGLIAQHPWLGGLAWHYLQYVLGLRDLGHDVYYVEDSGEWPYTMDGGASGDDWIARDCSTNVGYLNAAMARFGLGDRWAYKFPKERRWYGMPERRRLEVLRSADLLLNVSGTLMHPEQYREARRLVYIDSDPIFTQIKLSLSRGHVDFQKRVAAHDVHFSFGETLAGSRFESGYCWRPTRQPVVLPQWSPLSPPQRNVYSTVMSWTSYEPLVFRGKVYAQKDWEFRRFVDLPARIAPARIELAVNHIDHAEWQTTDVPETSDDASDGDLQRISIAAALALHKWAIVDPVKFCGSLEDYRSYIQSSKGEWSVAKNGYVQGRPGWFSERSACYLAAGRPVIVQDTGFSGFLPVGRGVVTFTAMDEAVAAINEVEGNYARHAKAAREIAEEYFDSHKVLNKLINDAMNYEPEKSQSANKIPREGSYDHRSHT
jgi:hypothetical protein